jgi:hypothetical protein
MGSSSSKASKQAQRAEDERRANIERTQRRIEGIYSDPKREADIQDFINSTRGYLQQDLDRTKLKNDRGLKFALARSGLPGGSTDIDQNRNLTEAYLRAAVEAERKAQGAGNQLRAADQEAKLGLFGQALGGLDMTTATSNALRSMQNNIGIAKNTQSENNFDSWFTDFGDLFTASRKSAGERRQGQEFGTLYGPRASTSTRVAGAT